MKAKLKTVVKTAWSWLRSPQATRLEIAIGLGLFKAIEEAIKHG